MSVGGGGYKVRRDVSWECLAKYVCFVGTKHITNGGGFVKAMAGRHFKAWLFQQSEIYHKAKRQVGSGG